MPKDESSHFKLLLSKKEASAALGVSVRTIENFILRKELVARKLGRRTLIPLRSLEEFARRDHSTPSIATSLAVPKATTQQNR